MKTETVNTIKYKYKQLVNQVKNIKLHSHVF